MLALIGAVTVAVSPTRAAHAATPPITNVSFVGAGDSTEGGSAQQDGATDGGPSQLTSTRVGEFTVYFGADISLADMFTALSDSGVSVRIFWLRDINAGVWLFCAQTASGAVVPGSASATLSVGDIGFIG